VASATPWLTLVEAAAYESAANAGFGREAKARRLQHARGGGERRRLMAFDPETFTEKFGNFLDELFPDDEMLTVDAIAQLFQRVRLYLEQEGVPLEFRQQLAPMIGGPFLKLPQISEAERVEIKRKWSEALGFDVPLPN
jgi:hypothetical protein